MECSIKLADCSVTEFLPTHARQDPNLHTSGNRHAVDDSRLPADSLPRRSGRLFPALRFSLWGCPRLVRGCRVGYLPQPHFCTPMALINQSAREITAKIVYYGPGLCGKTTNLQVIYDCVEENQRGRLFKVDTNTDRTLFFDLMALDFGKINDFTLRFQLYTVPGQVFYNASRRQVLVGADGVVFVADSDPTRLEFNIESMANLYDNLAELEMFPRPLVIQYNKRDLPGALPVDVLQQQLNPDNHPAFKAVATKGVGVFETLHEIASLVSKSLHR